MKIALRHLQDRKILPRSGDRCCPHCSGHRLIWDDRISRTHGLGMLRCIECGVIDWIEPLDNLDRLDRCHARRE